MYSVYNSIQACYIVGRLLDLYIITVNSCMLWDDSLQGNIIQGDQLVFFQNQGASDPKF
jgi:hypothetical protein